MEAASSSVFYEIAILLIAAAAAGFLGSLLRLPLIVSFIVVGLLVGPSALAFDRSEEHIDILAQLGVALLLFLVGLKLDVKLIRSMGRVALMTGLGQVLFTSIVGFGLCLALGFSMLTSLYVAVALTFSSTIIVVKLLSDKGELGALHGRIALGFLVVQDLVVVLAMVVLSALGVGAAGGEGYWDIPLVVAKTAGLIAGAALFIRYVADWLLRRLARWPELMILFAVGWAAFLAALASALGLSTEFGGLLAGVSLASSGYSEAITSRLVSLRDFLLLFFFVALGMKIDLAIIGAQILPAVVLSLFVLIGNPLIVLAIMGAMGYRARTGFLAGLTVAQISEFSLIFMSLGLMIGHVAVDAVGLVTLVGLITIAGSTYMILYSQRLYRPLAPLLAAFERKHPYREDKEQIGAQATFDAILFGLGRFGSDIAQGLREHGLRVLGVDFDPDAVQRWREQGWPAMYGDAGDRGGVEALPLAEAQWVIAAVPQRPTALTQHRDNVALVSALREAGFKGRVVVVARNDDEAEQLRRLGADITLLPLAMAARHTVEQILAFGENGPQGATEQAAG